MELFENNKNLNLLFRNRLSRVKSEILEKRGLDALILIFSYDSLNNMNILKFGNWLLFGHSSSLQLEEKALNFVFNETFLIIQKDHIYVFSSNDTKEFFYLLFSKLNRTTIEYEFTTKKEEANSELIQIIKIAKFLEHTYLIKKIGVPLLQKEKNNILELEKWPLITAYGLDLLGEGFFTLKHSIVDISQDLEKIYHVTDISACNNLIYTKAYKLETTLSDFFTLFDRELIDKRLNRSEMYLNENQELELLLINYNENKKTQFSYLEDLPDPRVLVGVNTDKEENSSEPLYKIYFDFKIPSFHMTYENFDAITGIRFGRTFFLSTLQKEYLDYDDKQDVKYLESRIYVESMFLFNMYYRLAKFMRTNQFDIISGKLDTKLVKSMLRQELNEFIEKEYEKNETNFNYFLKEDNIEISLTEYQILKKADPDLLSNNKVIALRMAVKEIASVISNRRIGSILYCDSFLKCSGGVFNLTQDIIPFKSFFTSNIHLTGNETYNYDVPQILRSISPCRFMDIEVKGAAFYHNCYNIPYLFEDSTEIGFDCNQMFLGLNGKLIVYENFIVISDNSLGYIVIEDKNVKEISYKDEIRYSVILISVNEGSRLPLSGIIKNEMLIYLPCASERMNSIKFDVFTYLKSKYNHKFRPLTSNKEVEYELVVKSIFDNEYENLSYISNSFNLTNIYDVFGQLYEFEYLSYKSNNTIIQENSLLPLQYEKYKNIKASLYEPNINCEISNIINIMFLFGTTLDNVHNFALSIQDLGKSLGIKSEIIISSLNMINDKEEFYKFYFNSITELSNNNKILIIAVQHEVKIIHFLNNLVSLFGGEFEDKYNILNISYAVNYNCFLKNKQKDLYSNFYNLIDEDLINFIFVDEGYVSTEKIDLTNKVIEFMNPKAVQFNPRSFSKNIKEVKKIFENNFNMKSTINFYNDYYYKCDDVSFSKTEEMFFELKYRVRKDILEEFLEKNLNLPLKYRLENAYKRKFNDENVFINMSDQEFQSELADLVKEVKCKANEPVIEKLVGFVKQIQSEGNENNTVYKVIGSYKDKRIEESDLDNKMPKEQIGLLISGQNILNNKEFINEILLSLSGVIPQFKPYRTKEALSEEEVFNLNLVNFFREIPEGWYWDGSVILDEEGNRYGQHPHLDIFIQEYLLICNTAVDEYNKKIRNEITKTLLI